MPLTALAAFLSSVGTAVAEGAAVAGEAALSAAETVGTAAIEGAKDLGTLALEGAKATGEAVAEGASEFGKGFSKGADIIATKANGSTDWGKTIARAAGRGTRTVGESFLEQKAEEGGCGRKMLAKIAMGGSPDGK